MEVTVKTIDIQGKEWFDKVNGNSYCSAVVTVNYGMEDEQTFTAPFQYGYDSAYEQYAFEALREAGVLPDGARGSYYCSDNKIALRSSIQRDCKKRDVVEHGKERVAA